ncbi:MAG: sulfatase-like hydrolase/transferase [Acidimicrobiales bacterium]
MLQALGGGVAAWTAAQAFREPTWNIIRSRDALAQTGPDVYVVTLDDCSPEYIGYYQSLLSTAYQGPIHTPELDALLAASWTATDARAVQALCAGSRASFLTAAPSTATGLFGEEGFVGLPPAMAAFLAEVSAGQLVSLPGFLTGLGYDTATRGKVDHSGALFDIPGQILHQGVYTSISALFNDPDYSPFGASGPDFSFMTYGALPAAVQHVDAMRVDEQIARINEPYTGQRVDFLGFALPHVPRTVHQPWLDLYDLAGVDLRATPAEVTADQSDLPATALADVEAPYLLGLPRAEFMEAHITEDGLKQHVRHMLATLSHTSYEVGRLQVALDAAARPYILVLTSDHGYMLGEKGHYSKGTLYDKALRVPLAIYSSDPLPAYPVGTVDRPISLLGLAKTVAQLVGVPDTSIPPLWEGHRFDDTSDHCTIHTWGLDAATQSEAMIFTDPNAGRTYKLIVHPGDDGELYNLTDDPGEIVNLLSDPPPPGHSEQWVSEAEAELRRRARRRRAREWLERGGRPDDPQHM